MIEFDESEYLNSLVEDSVLLAVLSLFSHLPIHEAIEIKDKLLYEGDADDRNTGSPASLSLGGPNLEHRDSHYTGDSQDTGRSA
jgi:hypothetical protein